MLGGTVLLAAARPQSTTTAPRQTPTLIPRSAEEREREYQAEHRVILNVKVTDESGKPVMGLKPEDFTLLDHQQPRAIDSIRAVEHATWPGRAHVILMLDAVNNSSRGVVQDRDEIRKFLTAGQGPLAVPVSIGLLTDYGITISGASQDRDALVQQVETVASDIHVTHCEDREKSSQAMLFRSLQLGASYRFTEDSPDCMNERFIKSISKLENFAYKEERTLGRDILIWMGPGWPVLEGKQFQPDTQEMKENFFEHLAIVTNALREAQITLDALTMPGRAELSSDHDAAFFDGVPSVDEVTAASLSLRALAHQSGGRVFEKNHDLASAIEQCIEDTNSYYVLSFNSSQASDRNEYHSLRVTVDRPGVKVRTNTVYYAEP